MRVLALLACFTLALAVVSIVGCGDSGSNPPSKEFDKATKVVVDKKEGQKRPEGKGRLPTQGLVPPPTPPPPALPKGQKQEKANK